MERNGLLPVVKLLGVLFGWLPGRLPRLDSRCTVFRRLCLSFPLVSPGWWCSTFHSYLSRSTFLTSDTTRLPLLGLPSPYQVNPLPESHTPARAIPYVDTRLFPLGVFVERRSVGLKPAPRELFPYPPSPHLGWALLIVGGQPLTNVRVSFSSHTVSIL